jgi:hypothetical protein
MGLKGYRLWAVGQLDSNVQSPTVVFGCVAVRDQNDRGARKHKHGHAQE